MTIGKLDKWVSFFSKVRSSFTFYIDNFDCTKKIMVLERWTYYILFFIFFLPPTFIRVKVVQLTFYRFNKLSNNLLLLTKIVPLQLCSIVNFSHHSCLQWNNKKMKKTTSSSYEILVNEMRHDIHKIKTLDD